MLGMLSANPCIVIGRLPRRKRKFHAYQQGGRATVGCHRHILEGLQSLKHITVPTCRKMGRTVISQTTTQGSPVPMFSRRFTAATRMLWVGRRCDRSYSDMWKRSFMGSRDGFTLWMQKTTAYKRIQAAHQSVV
jgi:hypothetical protein